MLEISNVNAISPQFKAGNTQKAYNPARQMGRDSFELNEAKRKEEKKEKWQKAGTIAQIGLAAAFVSMAVIQLLSHKANKRMMKAQEEYFTKAGNQIEKNAKDQVKAQAEELSRVDLKWGDFKGKKNVASLNSETTSSVLREKLNKLINADSLSDAAKEWGGKADGLNIMYLFGHGGTGKTYVAKQYAQEIGAIFTSIKYPDIGSPFKDSASMKINNFFNQIKAMSEKNPDRKIVVCIDEVDAIMRKVVDGSHGAEEAAKSRGALLTGLDKLLSECNNVTVITTSNYHPQSGLVDPIALRRFTHQIEVPLPETKQIDALLKMYLSGPKAITEDFFKSSEYKNFVKTLEENGYSNGEIELIAKGAQKEFQASLKGVPDSELKNHKFEIQHLTDSMNSKGKAASTTNQLMNIK